MTNGNRRFRRLAATGALALGSLVLVSASPASAARDTGDACPAGVAPEDGFTDTGDEGSAIESAVDCLVAYGVTSGTSATTYGGSGEVSRAQMATFIANKLRLVQGVELPSDAPDAFTDDDGSVHEGNINALAALEVVRGVGEGLFDPERSVTRAEMATFIVNQMKAAGATLPDVPETTEFPDIEGNTHEDNIKILEALDIVDGLADGTYGPNDPVSRGQMAFFLTRDIDVLVEQGKIEPIRAGNQTFTVTPSDAAELTVSSGAGNNAGARTYTANIGDASAVDIVLLPAENVSVAANGVVTIADNTPVAANNGVSIEVVNGVSTASNAAPGAGTTHVKNIAPANGVVTFTVDSVAPDSVVPVVFVNADNDDDIDVDGTSDEPTEDFGVGGVTTWIPNEAPTGRLSEDTSIDTLGYDEILSVDKDRNRIVGTFTYFYDENDTFAIDGDGSGCALPDEQVTLAQFEAELSAGDWLDGETFYQAEESLPSIFCLLDVAPDAPTIDSATAGELQVLLSITLPPTGFGAADTITLRRAASINNAGSPSDCTDDTYGAATTAATLTLADDEDPGVLGIQYTDTVTAAGCYQYTAVATVAGEQSGADTEETDAPVRPDAPPQMTAATAYEVDDGVGTTNQILVTFDEAVAMVDASKITVYPITQPNLVFTVTSATKADASGTKWLLTISQTLNDASTNRTYGIATEAGAYEDAAGNKSAAANPAAQFDY